MTWLLVLTRFDQLLVALLAVTVAGGWTITWALAWEYRCRLREAEAEIERLLAPKVRARLLDLADEAVLELPPPAPPWTYEQVPTLSPGMLALIEPWRRSDTTVVQLPVRAVWEAPPPVAWPDPDPADFIDEWVPELDDLEPRPDWWPKNWPPPVGDTELLGFCRATGPPR